MDYRNGNNILITVLVVLAIIALIIWIF